MKKVLKFLLKLGWIGIAIYLFIRGWIKDGFFETVVIMMMITGVAATVTLIVIGVKRLIEIYQERRDIE